jgi:hypothetical protein
LLGGGLSKTAHENENENKPSLSGFLLLYRKVQKALQLPKQTLLPSGWWQRRWCCHP